MNSWTKEQEVILWSTYHVSPLTDTNPSKRELLFW